jgi:hypothetical protein
VFKPAHSKVDEFRAGRTRQPDDEFLRECGLEPSTATAEIALAVRRAVAAVGLVDPLFVEEDIPAEIVPAIAAQLLEKEAIFVLFRLNSTHSFQTSRGRPENAPFWMAMTGGRLFLVAVSTDGQTYCDAFGQQTMVEYRGGLARRQGSPAAHLAPQRPALRTAECGRGHDIRFRDADRPSREDA